MGDVFAVAIVLQCITLLLGSEHNLFGLGPSGVRLTRIDVGFERIFAWVDGLPEGGWLLMSQLESCRPPSP